MLERRPGLWSTLVNLRGNGRACVYTEPMWGLSMALVLPYASVYMLALGIEDRSIGLLATISTLSQVLFGLLSGAITDKLGRRATTAVFDIIAWSIPCLIWAFAQNFWWFLVASLVNGAWQVTQNSWDCLLVEDVERRTIPHVYSLVKVAGDMSAIFAPIAAVLVAQFGLVPAVRILYLNAFVIMTAKVYLLWRYSSETRTGVRRRAAVHGVPLLTILRGYRGVLGLILHSKGMLFSLAISALVASVTLVTGTFWQVAISTRLGVPDGLLPYFPMVRSLLSMGLFFTLIPWLLGGHDLKRATQWGFGVYLAGQALLLAIPVPAGAADLTTYAMLAGCLLLDAFGAGILFMLAESLVALHVDRHERSRVMAIQRTCVMLAAAPFGWFSGWLSGMDRSWPFWLTSVLLALGLLVSSTLWVRHDEAAD
ncbi:MFS transporter [Propioniciclava coleopterorum]|uniref:MFS transporter n=1 Tax=Propioniciclava coleopterorum TaxID=2714937 RepID=A0A6G7Y5G6_9ACTN|nr:MFS transporter [Propioniciclava coleopterorum]QIK72055.1 MFS transporter [Propioniciclava coleopterorum]